MKNLRPVTQGSEEEGGCPRASEMRGSGGRETEWASFSESSVNKGSIFHGYGTGETASLTDSASTCAGLLKSLGGD